MTLSGPLAYIDLIQAENEIRDRLARRLTDSIHEAGIDTLSDSDTFLVIMLSNAKHTDPDGPHPVDALRDLLRRVSLAEFDRGVARAFDTHRRRDPETGELLDAAPIFDEVAATAMALLTPDAVELDEDQSEAPDLRGMAERVREVEEDAAEAAEYEREQAEEADYEAASDLCSAWCDADQDSVQCELPAGHGGYHSHEDGSVPHEWDEDDLDVDPWVYSEPARS